MIIQLHSDRKHQTVRLDCIGIDREESFWGELARGAELVSGSWSGGCMRLRNSAATAACLAAIESAWDRPSAGSIRGLTRFLEHVERGDFFYVMNMRLATVAERLTALQVLKADRSRYAAWVRVHNHYFSLYTMLAYRYDVHLFGLSGAKEFVGESDRKRRKCRFCGKSGADFRVNLAHAVPEALGNRLLFCRDECKECNDGLKSVEEHFMHLMDFRRAMYRLTRKTGGGECAEVHGRNYTIAPDSKGDAVLYVKRSCVPPGAGAAIVKFDHLHEVVDQDIYRALAKIAIDLMPSDKLCHFARTIDWIRKKDGSILPGALPSVLYRVLENGEMYDQPVVYLLFGKEEQRPCCTVLLFVTDLVYQYVVPYADVDGDRFAYDEQLDEARRELAQYFGGGWEPQQYFSWWPSCIWNYWDVDTAAAGVELRADNDPVFTPLKEPTAGYLAMLDKNIFNPKDVAVQDVRCMDIGSLARRLKRRGPSAFDFSLSREELSVVLDFNSSCGAMDFRCRLLGAGGTADDIRFEFGFGIERLMRLVEDPEHVTGDSFRTLIRCMWRKCVARADSHIVRRVALPPRERLLALINADEIIRIARVELLLPGGARVRTSYQALVE